VSEAVQPFTTIGHVTPRVDAMARVTGQARYTNALKLPGMLYARVLRSPHPHARLRRMDTREASRLPGVRAVITHANAQVVWGAGAVAGGRQYSDALKEITRQRREIFNNPVRCVGDALAAVAATDRHLAEQALALIQVDYELLPFVLDPEAALAADAPRMWPEGHLCLDVHNHAAPVVADHGDLAAGFAAAEQVFAQRYDTGFVHNAHLEPRCALAHWQGETLTLYTPTQGIANCRHDMARDLGLDDQHVRVVCHDMGGGFGNKHQNQDADLIAAILARHTKAPVLREYTRRDDWLGMHGRWPTVQQDKVGVTNDGTVTAIQPLGSSGMGP
jgi:CO/xanthine dehydrogenase Mo-binding subunit